MVIQDVLEPLLSNGTPCCASAKCDAQALRESTHTGGFLSRRGQVGSCEVKLQPPSVGYFNR